MSSFQSALMSWRDKGFDLEHLDQSGKEKVQRVSEEISGPESGKDCLIVREMVINDIQRIEQSMHDRNVVFYDDNPPTVFDRHLNMVDMSGYPERWVKIVGQGSLASLDELKELLDGIER